MIDAIDQDLLDRIDQVFKSKTAHSEVLKNKIIALREKVATHKDTEELAAEIGEILAEIFTSEVSTQAWAGEQLRYDAAKALIEPNLTRNYDIVSDYAEQVQVRLNDEAGLSMNAIKPEINKDRMDGIIKKIATYDDFDKGKWLLDEPVINFTMAVADEVVRANAEFQAQAGLRPKVVRKVKGNCCDWCKEVAGTYNYPDEVPNGVWRRHRYCRCTVEYFPGDGKKQDIWTKKWADVDNSDKIKERKALNKQTPRFIIRDSQFGKKAKAHMVDFGLDVKNPSDRILFERTILDIVNNCDEIIRGIEWRGQKDLLTGYLKGEDVVLVNNNDEFVTVLKGGVENARVKNARKR